MVILFIDVMMCEKIYAKVLLFFDIYNSLAVFYTLLMYALASAREENEKNRCRSYFFCKKMQKCLLN